MIGCILRNKERLQAIHFKNIYSKECVHILYSIDNIFKGFDLVKNNKNFHILLEILLAHGNYMNAESIEGEASGFQLSSLKEFYDIKSNDKKCTLFQYIIEFILDYFDIKILNFMPFLELFDKIQIKQVQESYNSFKEDFKSVEALKTMLETNKDEIDEDDKTEEFLKGFYEDANKTIKLVEKKMHAINEEYENISKYLGVKNIDIDTFISIMKVLYRKIFEALKLYRSNKEIEKKKSY